MKRILVFVLFIFLLANPTNVKADVAPPEQPPGSNPAPGSESTQVRMKAETVKIKVLDTPDDLEGGQATVTASFTMLNEGTQDETMMVRFPIAASDGWFNVNEISAFAVKVQGKTVATQKTMGEDPNFSGDTQVPWEEFKVTFPAGKEISIEVKYNQKATEFSPIAWFTYIFSTGSGWKDSIGSIDLIVEMPYEANIQNTLFADAETSIFTLSDATLSKNTISWHFDNLEPKRENNFRLQIVSPGYWQNILKQQAYIANHPKDGEAWGMLAKAYKGICISPKGRGFRFYTLDEGTLQVCTLSREAYTKAVTLKPKDPLWHAGFADMLGYYAYYAAYYGYDTRAESQQALNEIQTALALAPDDAKVQEIASEMSFFFPEGMVQNGNNYDYPWLTASPLPPTATLDLSTPPPTETIMVIASPTQTELSIATMPVVTATPAPEKTQTGGKFPLPFCGSLLVIPLSLFLIFRKHFAG